MCKEKVDNSELVNDIDSQKPNNDCSKPKINNEDLMSVVKTAYKNKQNPVNDSDVPTMEEQNPKTLDYIKTVIEKLVELMGSEDNQRRGLLRFFKWFLCLISFVPIIMCGILKGLHILDGYELLATIIVVPLEVLGVFNIIAKNLFGNDYRNTIPPMIEGIYKSISKK